MEEKGYRLPRHGDNVEELLKKMENLKQDFVLLKGCGDRWKYDSEGVLIGKECFFDFTYDELAEPVMAGKVVFLMWEDRLDGFPPTLCTCSYMNFGQTGVMVKIDKIQSTRVLLLTRGTNGEIVVSADEVISGTPDETDPIFTQWLQSHELYTKREVDDLLTPIESVIPSSASSSNKLADKDYVDNSIATSTAMFVGTFNSLSELQAVQNPTNNDYGFVIEQDAAGNEYYDRYKFNGSQWLFEYKVESTPFTADQWAAIQSGITFGLVTKLEALPTSQQLSTQLAGKQDTISDLATIRSGAAAGATAVQPATMDTALAAKQDTLTFDNAPTANSTNPVQSGGVYDAIEGGFYY